MTVDPDLEALSSVTVFLNEQLAEIDDAHWGLATPCEDWDLRALVDHVAGGNWFTLAVLDGATADESLARARAHFAGGSPTSRQAAVSTSDQNDAFQMPDVLGRTWHHVAGDLTGREMLRLRLHDLIVHAWDITQSRRSEAELPASLVSWGLGEVRSAESLALRHFNIEADRVTEADDPIAAYLRWFDRGHR